MVALLRRPGGAAPLLTGLALGLACCSPAADEAPADSVSGVRNLLLITVDTLRADHLGTYGYPRPTSPHLDRFAEQAVVFDAAQSSSSWTLPGIASIMTSFYTSTHGCWNGRSRLAPSFETLAERLHAAGWRTGAVVNHVFLARDYGLDQGFEDYDDALVEQTKEASHLAITAPAVTEKGLAWLAARGERSDEPWFLWVHYFDPHQDYQPHPGISEAFGETAPVDLYDGEIAFTDRYVGALLGGLRELGLERRTAVVVVADHGEEFEEHGRTGHRHGLFAEVQRVPLLIRAPGCAPRRVAEAVSLVDLEPTVLELLGLQAPDETAGRSLVPALEGRPLDSVPVLGELGFNTVTCESIVVDGWKLILDHGQEARLLFDHGADPVERFDVAADHPDRARRLEQELRRMVERSAGWRAGHPAVEELELTREYRQRLKDLGYVEDE